MAFPLASAAQDPLTPPSRTELGPPELRAPERPGPTLTIDSAMERAPCALDNPQYSEILVTLRTVRFSGTERAAEVSLAPAYENYLGRELPISVMCDIRAQATALLREEGYLAAVEIPEQSLAGGEAEFRVVLGKLTALRVRGEPGPSEDLIAGYLNRLVGADVFNINDAERYLLLADDVPGVDVRLSLRPAAGGEPGDLVGEIAVVRRRAVLDLNVQNFGSESVGRFGGLLRAEFYDLTGMGDRTGLSYYTTQDFDEQHTLLLAHDFRVGREGLQFGGQLTLSWTDPAIDLPGFDVESETIFATAYARYPFLRSQQATIGGTAGFDYVDQDVTVNDATLTRDRVRVAFARLDAVAIDPGSISRIGGYTAFEPRLRLAVSGEIRQGLDIFDAAPDCRGAPAACFGDGALPPSRVEQDPTPLVFRSEVTAEYRPVPLVRLALRMETQFSEDPLPAFEEFAAGNYSIGRGYDPGIVLGDKGYGLSGEISYGSLAPSGPKDIALQPYVFTDYASVRNEDPSRLAANPDRLWSAGGGLRAIYGGGTQADLSLAVPLRRTDVQSERGDVRLLFSITTRLLPWRY